MDGKREASSFKKKFGLSAINSKLLKKAIEEQGYTIVLDAQESG